MRIVYDILDRPLVHWTDMLDVVLHVLPSGNLT